MEGKASDRADSQYLAGSPFDFKHNSTVFIMMSWYLSVVRLPWGCMGSIY